VYPPKPKVMGGRCYFMLPKTCDDDCQLPTGEAWSRY
jgi:hypothetical protein